MPERCRREVTYIKILEMEILSIFFANKCILNPKDNFLYEVEKKSLKKGNSPKNLLHNSSM